MVANLGQVVLVKDIRSGSNSSDADNFILFNDKLYFSTNDGVNGKEMSGNTDILVVANFTKLKRFNFKYGQS